MKYLLAIMLFFMSFNLKAQYNTNSIIVNSPNYNNWYQCEDAGTGKASFYITVSFSGVLARNGYYYYDIFLYNNSFYRNGVVSSTYIKNIYYYIWTNGRWKQVYYQPYALVKPASYNYNGNLHAAYVYSITKIYKIKIVWQDVTIY